MGETARQVHCDDCQGEQFKVLIFGTGVGLSDHLLVCDFCATRVNLLNVETTVVQVTDPF